MAVYLGAGRAFQPDSSQWAAGGADRFDGLGVPVEGEPHDVAARR